MSNQKRSILNIELPVWIKTRNQLPPQDEVVDTISPGGQQQELIRSGNLYYLPDMSAYVYYTPEHWRRKN